MALFKSFTSLLLIKLKLAYAFLPKCLPMFDNATPPEYYIFSDTTGGAKTLTDWGYSSIFC